MSEPKRLASESPRSEAKMKTNNDEGEQKSGARVLAVFRTVREVMP